MTAGYWSGRCGVVTGAASGIGLALAHALTRRGAVVHMADIDAEAVTRAATAVGERARPQVLDVRDRAAVRAFIERVVQEDGRIDFLINNAGVVTGGEAHEIAAEHYDRVIDVNIRGVVHGVVAAYPVMVRQKSGIIVNMASLGGLSPVPLMVPYAMTKHAVVGLTTSLRIEAARHGVRVCAVCPAAVDTPLLNAPAPAELPPIAWQPDYRRFLERGGGPPCSPELVAEETLRGAERNDGLIIVPARARLVARMYRFAPRLAYHEAGRLLEETLRRRTPARPELNP